MRCERRFRIAPRDFPKEKAAFVKRRAGERPGLSRHSVLLDAGRQPTQVSESFRGIPPKGCIVPTLQGRSGDWPTQYLVSAMNQVAPSRASACSRQQAQEDWDEPSRADEETLAEEKRDAAVENAKAILRQWFGEHPEEVFYQQQLEVIFELKFFHWITRRAAEELVAERRLLVESVPLAASVPLRVYRRPSNRNWRRKAGALARMVTEFSPGTALGSSLGQHGELMFDSGLARFGFLPIAKKVREWNGRQWTASGHDLDRVYRRDGIEYGAEIKNTLKYVPRAEFGAKLEMCRFLGLRPLFITRCGFRKFWRIDSGNSGRWI